MNTITVIGNVGKEPELRFTPNGLAIAKFSVADTRGKGDDKQTTWHYVTCFDEQAENVCEQVKKGSRVLVTGRLAKEKFTDKNGNERESVDIIADDVCLSLRFKPKSGGAPAAALIDEDPF